MSSIFKEKSFFLAWIISLGATLAIIVGLYLSNITFGFENFSKNVSLPIYTTVPGVLVILSIWSLSRSNSIANLPKRSLVFLTISFCCWFVAEQTWNLYEHVLDIDPYPSIADFFYIAAPMFMFGALLNFLKSQKIKISKKKIFSACFLSAVILVPSIYFIIEKNTESDILETIIALSYPIVDSVLLVPVIISILFTISTKSNFFWLMILLGIIILIIADNLFLFLVINDEYVDGHPIDILWISSYTIWAFMMFYSIVQSKTYNYENIKKNDLKLDVKNIEKHGVLYVLILINASIVILLIQINNFAEAQDDLVFAYFSFILVAVVIIFSSMVVILNSKLNKSLQNKTKQLDQATHELIKSERFTAIGELASRISHDIRNPLSNIQMSIELIKNCPPGTKLESDLIQKKIEVASKNVERISHQINDVLGFVKNQKIEKRVFRISSCINESIEAIRIPTKITIQKTNLDTEILADPFQLQIVFNNILMNAIQAIGKNKGKINIEAIQNYKETILKISNSGPEIPDNVFPHIFESLITTKQVGTGLGLISCKTIIENHGGSITIQKNPVMFTLKFPKT